MYIQIFSIGYSNGEVMRHQENDTSCGPACIRAILHLHGIRSSEKALHKKCALSKRGTYAWGLENALSSFGFATLPITYRSKITAWDKLRILVDQGCPVIVALDKCKHWACVIGMIGDSVLLYDPSPDVSKTKDYSTVWAYSKQALLDRWKFKEDGKIYHYGIAVIKEF
jgi:ATP-binding cassette, subfamily C, bacteriocin exporter